MSHTTTIEIDGAPLAFDAESPYPRRLSRNLRGVSSLTLERSSRGPETTDPYCGKSIVLKIDGVARFAGDIVGFDPQPGEKGWQVVYQALDLRNRGDRIPFTDSNTKMDSARWNFDPEDADKIDARLGRTVGQIIGDALTMQENAEALYAKGIGAYTSLSPPTLPADTLADLAAMTVIPPTSVSMGGERFLGSLEGFMSSWAPNHGMEILPDGTFRFRDLRAVVEHVLTLGDCSQRVVPTGLSRSVSECFQRVLIRGQSVAEPKLLTLASGGLVEDFAWGTHDNAEAKAIWTPDDYLQDKLARSQGTCTCTDTTHVALTSTPGTDAWAANDWDQGHRKGRLYVYYSGGSGIDQFFSSRIVANTAKTSGGTSTVTLESPLPSLDFDHYTIYGLSSGASLVYRKYKAADPDIRAALARRLTYPVPYVNATGSAASFTSYPVGSVCWYLPFADKLSEAPDPIDSIDPSTGTIIFNVPTYSISNNAPPEDVRALVGVYTSSLRAIRPANVSGSPSYAGTSHVVEGLQDTLVITIDQWRDPANQANVEAYAQDVLDSVKDAMIEGSIVIHDLFMPALTFGIGLSVAGDDYVTGWESSNIPMLQSEIVWNSRAASLYTTTMRVGNRRQCFSSGAFMSPERKAADGTLNIADYPVMTAAGGFGGYDAGPASFAPSISLGGPDDSDIDWKTGRDLRDARDRTSWKDPTSARDPRSARSDAESGGRNFAARKARKADERQQARNRRILDSAARQTARWERESRLKRDDEEQP